MYRNRGVSLNKQPSKSLNAGFKRVGSPFGSDALNFCTKLLTKAIIAEMLYREQQLGVDEIAQCLHISKVTLCKYLRHRKVVIRAHRKMAAAKASD